MKIRAKWERALRQCWTTLVLVYTLNLCAGNCASAERDLVLTGGTLYTRPDAAPLPNAVVVVRGNTVYAVGKVGAVRIPPGARMIDCSGLTVTAGFQNSHVHFLEAKWLHTKQIPASKLARQLNEMLTSYGFTTVVDTASDLTTTTAIRARIESGEVPGPRIFTAGPPLFPHDAIPFYYGPFPPEMLQHFHQPASLAEAVRAVRDNLAGGADITKLYTGSLRTPFDVKTMEEAWARAAVRETHRRHKLVFAHPSSVAGIRVAIDSGADVLAHTTASPTGSGPWPADLIAEIKRRHVSVIPTLKLWGYEMRKARQDDAAAAGFTADGVGQLEGFVKSGGDVLFGTDVGYMAEYDPMEEYVLMARAGMSAMQILTALTVAPATRFGEQQKRGRVEPGMQADLVILDGDPMQDVRNFARVRYTIRKGQVLHPLAPQLQ
ncbi:MAG TPA: amidohydrolase family protein [Bryobacteraceae bacterium]|nr:amidohydrolase family protein [Bryobacteraceae bacterium]